MTFQQRVEALVQLGKWMEQQAADIQNPLFTRAYQQNNWFTPAYASLAFKGWAELLTNESISKWMRAYALESNQSKTIALILAGNIPLVGFHDILSTIVTGNIALIKYADDDSVLLKAVVNQLQQLSPQVSSQIRISESRLPSGYDAVIATGSNNSNRYFEYYFRNQPSLLRANRNSVAILTGDETPEELAALGTDIFTYFGLGCRNVSKLYVPKGYDFVKFYESIELWNHLANHHKYMNNYTYHKAILLMNLTQHLDNNFLLIKEDERLASPLGMLFYERYESVDQLASLLKSQEDQLQCVVGTPLADIPTVPFGKAQFPELTDYADGADTVAFLLNQQQ
ncbi:MAG: acyl-CoA reductase [Bacteroidia bacterium]|jgi:hypothetical protein|nr:acyl-CoA reductase [Bacteroidia bacterium]